MRFTALKPVGRLAGNEAEEIRRAKAHDAAVWAAWHDQHYPFVYGYALSRLRNQQDAEDVASQVFLEAIKAIGRYRYQGRPVLAWLYGIARNLVSHRNRDSGRAMPLSQLGLEAESSLASPADDGGLERIVLESALEVLKPEHREVLVLRFLLDLPTKQVALVLGKTEPATYSLQVRALSALRREMAETNFDEELAIPNDLPSLSA